MNTSTSTLIDIFKLNTRLYINSLQNVDDEQARKRVNDTTNSIIFIASHLLDARYFITNLLGESIECPFKEIFDQVNSIDEFKEIPPIADIKTYWSEISEKLTQELSQAKQNTLHASSELAFPVVKQTISGSITFLAEHESYHIGQIGFLRKYLGLDSMNYS